MLSSNRRETRRIVLIYAVFALLWILLSDKALQQFFTEPAQLMQASVIKGWAFVLITSALLFALLNRLLRKIELANRRAEDIRRRKNAELLASARRLQFALDTSGIGSLELDLKTLKTRRTALHDRIFGYEQPLDEWTPETFLSHVHPDDRNDIETSFRASIEQGRDWNREFRIRRADGRERWLWLASRPMTSQPGRISRAVVIVQDVTRRREAREEIRRLNSNLEQRVRERTIELEAANRELDSFAYAVSHDLRAPLRAMSGFSQALVEDHSDQLDGEARQFLDEIIQASHHMGELIEGILTLSRCTRGELERKSIDFSRAARQQLDRLALSDPERHVDTRIDPDMKIIGDPRTTDILLANLLDNAWKYTRKTDEPWIHVGTTVIDGQSGFCVEDNGAGFDMAHAERLFKPFQRLHRQEEFKGTGIGLATVQRIVQRHGGCIEAEGQPGQGARFRFTLASASESTSDQSSQAAHE